MDFTQYGEKPEEWLAVEDSLPQPPSGISPAELKRLTNDTRMKAAQQQMKTLASKVIIQDFDVPTRDGSNIQARVYRSSTAGSTKALAVYLHFHGGGFFFGGLASEDATCSRIAIEGDSVVVHANYRHTPEFTFPTAWFDAEDALAWVVDQAPKFAGDNTCIIVGGISAGAYLTSSLMLTLHREQNPIRARVLGQVLMIPPVVHRDHAEPYTKQLKDPSVSSWKQHEFAPFLPVSRINFFNEMLFLEPTLAEDHRANPGLVPAEDIASLPPTTFGICGLDPLRDEGLMFSKLLHDNHVPTNVNVFKGTRNGTQHVRSAMANPGKFTGLPHGFRSLGDKLPAGSRAWDRVIADGIKWSLSRPALVTVQEVQVH